MSDFVLQCECFACVNAGHPPKEGKKGTLTSTIIKVMRVQYEEDGIPRIWTAAQLARYGWGIKFCEEEQVEYYNKTLRPKITKTIWRLLKRKLIVKHNHGMYRLVVRD